MTVIPWVVQEKFEACDNPKCQHAWHGLPCRAPGCGCVTSCKAVPDATK